MTIDRADRAAGRESRRGDGAGRARQRPAAIVSAARLAQRRGCAGRSGRPGRDPGLPADRRPRAAAVDGRSRRSRRPRTRSAQPMALWPHGFDLSFYVKAWTQTHIDRYFLNTVWIAAGSWLVQIVVATTARLRAVRPAAAVHRAADGARAGDPVRAVDRAARAAVPDRRRHADRASSADRHVLGGLAAGRRERVQRDPGQAVLRQPAARDLRGGPGRRRRTVPPLLVDRAADVAARSSGSCPSSP